MSGISQQSCKAKKIGRLKINKPSIEGDRIKVVQQTQRIKRKGNDKWKNKWNRLKNNRDDWGCFTLYVVQEEITWMHNKL